WCMIRQAIRRPVVSAIAAISVLIAVAVGGSVGVTWWVGLSNIQQMTIAGGAVVVGVGLLDRVVARVLRFSPIVLILKLIVFMIGIEGNHARTGREEYDSGAADSLRRVVSRSADGAVPVDNVFRRDPAGPASPVLDRAVTLYVAGRT